MKLINILLLFLLFTQFCVSQTIDEKYEFTLKAVEKNNKEGIFLYMNDILDYEKENGIDTNYLKTLEYFSSYFYSISDFENTLKLDEVILETKEKIFGINNNEYILTLENIAHDYVELGNYVKALETNNTIIKNLKKNNEINSGRLIYTLSKTASNNYYLGNYSEALKINLYCKENLEKTNQKQTDLYLEVLGNLANNYSKLSNESKSIEFNLECLFLTEKINGKSNRGYYVTLGNLAGNYANIGNYKKAIEEVNKCLKLIIDNKNIDSNLYYNYKSNLASFYIQNGDLIKALEINLDCLKYFKNTFGIENYSYIVSLSNTAENYSDLGKYNEALVLNKECLKIGKKVIGEDHLNYLTSLGNLAGNYKNLGEYQNALDTYINCLKIEEKTFGNEHSRYLTTLSNLAMIYLDLGNNQRALELNLQCLKTKEKILGNEHPDYLTTLGNLATIYSDLGNYQKALEINLQCLKTKEKTFGIEHPNYLVTLGNLAGDYSNLGNYQKALEINLQCLKTKEKIFGIEHPGYLLTLGNLAFYYSNLGNYQKALELNLQCLKIREKILGVEHPDYLLSLSNNAFTYFDLKQYHQSDSLILLENKIFNKTFQSNLLGLSIDLQGISKSRYINKILTFSNYSILRKSENPDLLSNAFSSWLNLNGMISNQSAQLESQIRKGKDSSLIQLFEKWQKNKLQLLKYFELTIPELEKRGINITKLEEEINEQERALSRGSEVFSEMKKTYVLSDIQQQLKEDEAYVDIVRLPYYNFNTNVWSDTIRYLAYIITKDTKEIPTTVLLENGNQLEEEIASYYAENTFGKTKREKDSISYAYFWKPISSVLEGKRKIYLSSGGVYNNINVQTLFNPSTNKYVSEELEVQLVNNGRTFIQQKTKKQQLYTNNTATFIGYPNFNGTLSKGSINEDAIYATTREFSPMLLDTLSRGANVSPLPGTKKEVETIGELLKTKKWDVNVFTENNASEEEIKKVESPRVLHIATHGYFLKQTDNLQKENGLRMMGMDTKRFVENPLLRSGLLLSGVNKTLKGDTTKASENGILTAYEAAYLHLQGTELVVLSACETGKGELKNGEGVYGLRKSFADAGAKNIIMSLWKVDDKVTQEFMTSFYTNWSTGITIREAFNKTQQSIKALYPQPYYWGAFILVGE